MYFDATFFVRLYIEEPGYERIRALVQNSEQISSSIVGKMKRKQLCTASYVTGRSTRTVLNKPIANLPMIA